MKKPRDLSSQFITILIPGTEVAAKTRLYEKLKAMCKTQFDCPFNNIPLLESMIRKGIVSDIMIIKLYLLGWRPVDNDILDTPLLIINSYHYKKAKEVKDVIKYLNTYENIFDALRKK